MDLKYWINSSASLVLGASDSTRVQAILLNLGGIKGSAAALWMSRGVSWCLMISHEVELKTGADA